MDTARLAEIIEREGAKKIPMVMLTVTNNSGCGQPVSMENIRTVKSICKKHGIPLYIDACRFAENAYFHQTARARLREQTPRELRAKYFRIPTGHHVREKKTAWRTSADFSAPTTTGWRNRKRIC